MNKKLLFVLLISAAFYSCKKDKVEKQEPEANADIAGSFRLVSYTRSDTKEYTATELPCLLNTVFIVKTNGTTAAYSENGASCLLTPLPPANLHITLGGGTDTIRSTYVRSGANLTISLVTNVDTRKSYANFVTVNGQTNLTIRDTSIQTFSGLPIYTKRVLVKQ